MIEVNNFDKISNLLRFDGNSVYLVWLVLRNKDGNTKAKGNNKNRTIKSYYFKDKDHFESRREEIITLCKTFNCRAYICVNPKPIKYVLHQLQNRLTEVIFNHDNGQNVNFNSMIDSAIMKASCQNDKLWVVDIDVQDPNYTLQVFNAIDEARSSYDCNVVAKIFMFACASLYSADCRPSYMISASLLLQRSLNTDSNSLYFKPKYFVTTSKIEGFSQYLR